MSERTLSVLDGSTFVVGDRLGDVREETGREHGFYCADTRFLSRWVLGVDEAPLELLGLDQSSHFAAQFFLTPHVGADEAAPCSIIRRRLIDHVWIEEVTVVNHRHEDSEVRVALEVDTDFADLFEVKDGVVAERDVSCHHDDGTLTFGTSARVSGGRSQSPPAALRRSPDAGSPTCSGWGVRTLGTREAGYNPLGYHTGTRVHRRGRPGPGR